MNIYIATFGTANIYIFKASSDEEALGIARGYFMGKEDFFPDFVCVELLDNYLEDTEIFDVLSRSYVENFIEDLKNEKQCED